MPRNLERVGSKPAGGWTFFFFFVLFYLFLLSLTSGVSTACCDRNRSNECQAELPGAKQAQEYQDWVKKSL